MSDRLTTILIDEIRPIIAALVREQVITELDHRLPTWLTPAQAGESLGIGASAVRERIRRGILPARRWENRLYIRAADIDAEIEHAPSATVVADHDKQSPRDVGASGGAATRSAPRDA